MLRKIMLVTIVLSMLAACPAFAGKIFVTIEDVSSEYKNASSGVYYAEKLIGIAADSNDVINTGLDINGPGTHSTVSSNLYTEGQKGTMWMSNSVDYGPQYIIFDLQTTDNDLAYLTIWNWNDPGTLDRGVNELNIYVSDTSLPYGDEAWSLETAVVLDLAPGDSITAFGQRVDITSQNVRYVLFEIMSNYRESDGRYSGLSEVVFSTNPATCDEMWYEGLGMAMDFNQDCYINLQDFAQFAQVWMLCNDPTDPACQ